MQATLPRLGLRGVASELAWRLGPVSRLRFHGPVGFLPHRRSERLPPRRLSALFLRPLQLTLHGRMVIQPRFSFARRWFALQFHPPQALRAVTAKPMSSCLKSKNQNHTQLALACHPHISSPPGFCGIASPLTPRVHGGWRGFLRTSPKTLAAVFGPVFSLRWPVLSVPAPCKTGEVLKHKI